VRDARKGKVTFPTLIGEEGSLDRADAEAAAKEALRSLSRPAPLLNALSRTLPSSVTARPVASRDRCLTGASKPDEKIQHLDLLVQPSTPAGARETHGAMGVSASLRSPEVFPVFPSSGAAAYRGT
jgi:hypothetical protein